MGVGTGRPPNSLMSSWGDIGQGGPSFLPSREPWGTGSCVLSSLVQTSLPPGGEPLGSESKPEGAGGVALHLPLGRAPYTPTTTWAQKPGGPRPAPTHPHSSGTVLPSATTEAGVPQPQAS